MSLHSKITGLKQVWQFDNRWSLIFSKTLFPREPLHIYRYKGLEFLTDHAAGDANGARDVLTSPMYRRFLPNMKLSDALNILDLGANNGGFPLLLQAEACKLKKVVSVELSPRTYPRLRFNLEHNLKCEVVVLNAALCGETRLIDVSLGDGSPADSIYEHGSGSKGKKYQVKGLTLDEICAAHFGGEIIDLCKMDVEGAEFEVFGQPEHRSLERCRYLIMEIHERDGRKKEEILPVIAELGLVRQPTTSDADPTVHFFVNSRLN